MKRMIIALLLLAGVLLQNTMVVAAEKGLTLYPVADNYVDSKYPNLGHYGSTSVLYVGNSYDHAQNIWGSERIYIRFDLGDLPRNRMVARATLTLWQFYAPATNQTYEAHRVLDTWNETKQNWNSQPQWASAKTSETIAPSHADVIVEWDITSDVQAWYSGQAPNYGTMIKAAKEERAQDASSGFWSREYPIDSHEEWRPKLVIVLQPEPSSTYVVTIAVSGLPNATLVQISVDGESYGQVSPSRYETLTFDRGTTHTIAVDQLVPGVPGVRYRCDNNETEVHAAGSHVFTYSVEYLVTFLMEPSSFFQAASTGWYRPNSTLSMKRTGPDVAYTAMGTRFVFDAWYVNDEKLAVEPTTVVVDRPTTLEGRYRTEYYLNVTSPIGSTEGSGWYAKDSIVFFSIDRRIVRAEGLLGMLGVKRSFMKWVGSGSFVGIPVEPRGSLVIREPTTIQTVWQDDWSEALVNMTILLILAVLVGVGVIVRGRRPRRGRSPTKASST